MPHDSPKPDDRIVGHVLRSTRERLGLTQEDAADKAGLHRAQYGRYEAGQNAPSFLTVIQIARRLGASSAELAPAESHGSAGAGCGRRGHAAAMAAITGLPHPPGGSN